MRWLSLGALGLVAVMAAVTMIVVTGGRLPAEACSNDALFAGEAKIGGPFELVDGSGRTVTEREVFVEPSLLYFGFANCPGICPVDNARNAAAISLLELQGLSAQPVFVSVDPERDTPEALAEYGLMFHDRMITLTGSTEQVRFAAAAYRVAYSKRPMPNSDDYAIDHSTYTYLVLPGEGVVEFFRRNETPERIAEAVMCFSRSRGYAQLPIGARQPSRHGSLNA